MGWSFRKSFRILPGIRINLSKRGPRLSVGIPGARASMDLQGKTRIYGGAGPLRYQKTTTLGSDHDPNGKKEGLLDLIRRLMQGQ